MRKMNVWLNRVFDGVEFILLGTLLPLIVEQGGGDREAFKIIPLYVLYIVVYVVGVWLYHRLFLADEQKWWKFLLLFIWLYFASVGLWLLSLLLW